jgi:hypothetical protein
MIIVNEKHLVLEYDEELKTIIQTWKGFFTSEKFREGVEETNKLFEKKAPVKKFLVDTRACSVVKGEDTTWAAQTAIPTAIRHGLKYYGFVLPENVFTQVSLNNFQEQLNQPSLEISLFKTLEEAKQWAHLK